MVDGRRLMQRLVLVVVMAALAAVGILYGLRRAERTPHATVTVLLPRGTVLLGHVPDFNRTRSEWHQSDLYKLYHEPAVQDFLSNPLSKVAHPDTAPHTGNEIARLYRKHPFLALPPIEYNNPHLAL